MGDESHFDELNEECGVFGVVGHGEAAQLAYYGLHALQHRGQESAGIVTTTGEEFHVHRDLGLVTEVFNSDRLQQLKGEMAIGHVRYTKSGESGLLNVQPLVFNRGAGPLAIATNGNLVNGAEIRRELEETGSIFQTTSNTEVIAHLIVRSRKSTIEEAIKEALRQLVGAYALLILTKDHLFVAQDPHGLRPLSVGRLEQSYVFSSETCALGCDRCRTLA